MTAPKTDIKARDIMTPRVVSIRSDASVDDAVALMVERHISGLPVVDAEGKLVGMITEGDLLQRSEIGTERRRPHWLQMLFSPGRLADDYTQARGRKVNQVMTQEVVSATEDTPLETIVALMSRKGIKRVPIVMNDGPIGMVSRADVLRALAHAFAAGAPAGPRTDEQILADIEAEFARSGCIPTALIDVTVTDGVVALRGAVTDDRERVAAKVAVENVPGVKAVRDHLAWVEPMSGTVIPSAEDEAAAKAEGTRAA